MANKFNKVMYEILKRLIWFIVGVFGGVASVAALMSTDYHFTEGILRACGYKPTNGNCIVETK